MRREKGFRKLAAQILIVAMLVAQFPTVAMADILDDEIPTVVLGDDENVHGNITFKNLDDGSVAYYVGDAENQAAISSNGFKITGTTTKYNITVKENVKVTLYLGDLSVGAPDHVSALVIEEGANVTLVLEGEAIFTGGGGDSYNPGGAGIRVADTATLTIKCARADGPDHECDDSNCGNLTATGGYLGAGIGGDWCSDAGTIKINGGNIEARGGGGGAGIGGGFGNGVGTIEIAGGTITASGGQLGAGIGGQSAVSIEINIKISGGKITATGGANGVGIGNGGSDVIVPTVDLKVAISGSKTTVEAQSGDSGVADIGITDGIGSGRTCELQVTGGAKLDMTNSGKTSDEDPDYKDCIVNSAYYPELGLEVSQDTDNSPKITLTANVSGERAELKDVKTITFEARNSSQSSDDTPAYTETVAISDLKATCAFNNLSLGGVYTFTAKTQNEENIGEVKATSVPYKIAYFDGLESEYTYGCEPFEVTLEGAANANSIAYEIVGDGVATIDQDATTNTKATVTILKAGTFKVKATVDDIPVCPKEITVNKATPTMTLATAGDAATDGFTLTAAAEKVGTGKVPSGTVQLLEDGEDIQVSGTLDGDGKATFTLNNRAAGSHTYKVVYTPDANSAECYNSVNSDELSVYVLQSQQKYKIDVPDKITYGDDAFALKTTGQGSGAESFASSDAKVVEVYQDRANNNQWMARIIGKGQVTITATKQGDAAYAKGETKSEINVAALDISKVSTEITLANHSYTYTGESVEPEVTSVTINGTAIPKTAYTVSYSNNSNVGTATVTVTAKADSNYTGEASTTFEITKPEAENKFVISKAMKTTSKSNTIKWKKVSGADGYFVYAAKGNAKNAVPKLKKIDDISAKKVSYTHKGLKKNTFYTYQIVAYKKVGNQKITIGKTITLCAYTANGKSKYSNPASIKVNSSITVKKGKTKKLTASAVAPKGKKLKSHSKKITYTSSDTSIATVSKSGTIKGKKKGTCTIYVTSQNGITKSVKVKVK